MKFSNIKLGSKGEDVKILQALLRAQGLLGFNNKPLEIDGEAGSNTIKAINDFQTMMRAYGIECGTNGYNDSICGELMWSCLLGL